MSDFCPAVFVGASLIDALDSLLGDWQIYDYKGHGPHREEIKPLIESLANGEISVSAITQATHNGTWGAVVETTLPKEFWRYGKFYVERKRRSLVEVPAPGQRVIYSDPRIGVATATLVEANAEPLPYGQKGVRAKQYIQEHRAELQMLSQAKAAKLIAGAVGCRPSTAKNALRDEGL